MTVITQQRRCVYCGCADPLTVDHIPPKLLLFKPYPKNLLTVPACWGCNQSFMLDDEYTRNVIAIDIRAASNTDARANLPAIMRSLQRPTAGRFVEYLARQATPTAVLDSHGDPMGTMIEIDRSRVNATGARLIRGLHFVEAGTPIPKGGVVRVEAKAGISPGEPDALKIARVYRALKDRRDREIGSAFSYVACFGLDFSIWVMLLYDYFVWVGTVDTRKPASRPEEGAAAHR